MNFSHHKKGYSLVEVMVAISILMLAIAGPLTIAAKGLQSAQYAKDQIAAFLLAQEGIEAFVSVRNQAIIEGIRAGNMDNVWNWTNHTSGGSGISYCFDNAGCNIDFRSENVIAGGSLVSCSNLNNCLLDYRASENPSPYRVNDGTASDDSIFTRVIKISEVNSNELKITSTVSWSSKVLGGQTKDVTLTSAIFKLYETP